MLLSLFLKFDFVVLLVCFLAQVFDDLAIFNELADLVLVFVNHSKRSWLGWQDIFHRNLRVGIFSGQPPELVWMVPGFCLVWLRFILLVLVFRLFSVLILFWVRADFNGFETAPLNLKVKFADVVTILYSPIFFFLSLAYRKRMSLLDR